MRDFEPHLALKGGSDGLGPLERIARSLFDCMNPNARAFIEIGYDQGQSAPRTLRDQGLKVLRVIKDLGHNDRVVVVKLPS